MNEVDLVVGSTLEFDGNVAVDSILDLGVSTWSPVLHCQCAGQRWS